MKSPHFEIYKENKQKGLSGITGSKYQQTIKNYLNYVRKMKPKIIIRYK